MKSILKSKGVRGFTLIELMVVIAIIALLSAIVILSLNSARSKGSNVNVKSNLANMRTQAALFNENNGRVFDGLCSDPGILAASSSATVGASYVGCSASGQVFSILAVFKSSDGVGKSAWCVDSGGYSGYSASTTVTAGALCK